MNSPRTIEPVGVLEVGQRLSAMWLSHEPQNR